MEGVGHAAVDCHDVADTAVVGPVVHVAEVVPDAPIRQQAPIRQHPDDIAIDGNRLPLLHDDGPGQAAAQLHGAVGVGVIPVGARVRHIKLICKGAARCDRRLRMLVRG